MMRIYKNIDWIFSQLIDFKAIVASFISLCVRLCVCDLTEKVSISLLNGIRLITTFSSNNMYIRSNKSRYCYKYKNAITKQSQQQL